MYCKIQWMHHCFQKWAKSVDGNVGLQNKYFNRKFWFTKKRTHLLSKEQIIKNWATSKVVTDRNKLFSINFQTTNCTHSKFVVYFVCAIVLNIKQSKGNDLISFFTFISESSLPLATLHNPKAVGEIQANWICLWYQSKVNVSGPNQKSC